MDNQKYEKINQWKTIFVTSIYTRITNGPDNLTIIECIGVLNPLYYPLFSADNITIIECIGVMIPLNYPLFSVYEITLYSKRKIGENIIDAPKM